MREAEKLVQGAEAAPSPKPQKAGAHRDITRLQEQIAEQLGTKVGIQHGSKGSGKLVITYKTLDHLDVVLSKLGIQREA